MTKELLMVRVMGFEPTMDFRHWLMRPEPATVRRYSQLINNKSINRDYFLLKEWSGLRDSNPYGFLYRCVLSAVPIPIRLNPDYSLL